MTMPNSLRGYWLLMKILMFPFAWLKWLILVCAAMLAPALIISYITGSSIPWLIAGGLPIGIYLLLNIFSLPSQFLCLISSKQLGQLPGLRPKSMVIFLGSNLISGALIAAFFAETENTAFIPSFIDVSLSLAIFNTVILITAFLWPKLLGFSGIAAILLANSYHSINKISAIYSGLILIICWAAFILWSLAWKPKFHHRFGPFLSQKDMAETLRGRTYLPQVTSKSKILNSKPYTLIGTLLLGAPDGWQAEVKRVAFLLMLFALAFFVLSHFFSKNSRLSSGPGFFVFFAMALIGMSMQFVHSIFNNLHKLWLHFGESRSMFWGRLEKLNFLHTGTTYIICLAGYLFMRTFSITYQDRDLLIVLISILGALNMGICFYAGLVIYCRAAAHTGILAALQ
jgi:hypothetical protein